MSQLDKAFEHMIRRPKSKALHALNLMCICVEDRRGRLHFERYMKPGSTYRIDEIEANDTRSKFWITRENPRD